MKKIVLFCCLIFILSCQKKQPPLVSFYFWKTNFKLSSIEKKILINNNVKKIYLRYFDVNLINKKPFPIAPVQINESISAIEIVPVIFIKNEVFTQSDTNVEELSINILKLVNQINSRHKIRNKELQIDCDWTLDSREKYFNFIQKVKQKTKCKISVTIRLHQVKFSNATKIPEVDNGVLMLYNMGKISSDSKNSIYEKEIAANYITYLKKYPLTLNVALPIFSWSIHSRDNQVINLISKTNNSTFDNDTNFLNYDKNYFKVQQNTIKMGLYFKKGDIIKTESIAKEDLEDMIDQLSQNCAKQPLEIIYYDLDEFNLKQYNDEFFFKKCNSRF
jgi:hypothetical protein